MKRIVILGSTGSIGESALRVVAQLPSKLRVVGLAAQGKYERLLEQAESFGVGDVALADPDAAAACAKAAPAVLRVHSGDAGLCELTQLDCDLVLCAVVGIAGLSPTLAAIGRGVDVALATKEVLVAAGGIVTAAARENNAQILPVDSEHSAMFQCMEPRGSDSIARILLTASGGPFAGRADVDLYKVTVEQALNQSTWMEASWLN